MDTIAKIFGGAGKVKVMRLFLFNPGTSYDVETVATKTKENKTLVRKELNTLEKAGLIRKKSFIKITEKGKRGKIKILKKKTSGYVLDQTFPYMAPLEHFLIDVSPLKGKDIVRRLKKVGNIKLVIISGVFIHDMETRVDLLVVGDHLKKGLLESSIAGIEAVLGKEIRYVAFETEDFNYRLGMYDKLIRDILDYPHQEVLNKGVLV